MKKIISGLKSTSMLMFFVLTSSTMVNAQSNGEPVDEAPYPTLETVSITSTCPGGFATVTLTGLLPNTSGSGTYQLFSGQYPVPGAGTSGTFDGTSSSNGTFSFTPDVPFTTSANGLSLKVTSLTSSDGVTSYFDNVSATIVVGYPTLTGIEIMPACAGSTTTVKLTGLRPNITGSCTYKLGPFPAVTVNGTSDAYGEFIFTTPVLTPAANNLPVKILSLKADELAGGCETTFNNIQAPVVVLAKPTLTTVTSESVCVDGVKHVKVVLSGLKPNTYHRIDFTRNGQARNRPNVLSNASGKFTIDLGVATVSDNDKVVTITKLTNNTTGCVTNFTGKSVTLSTGYCGNRGTVGKEETIAEGQTSDVVTLYPNPVKDILNISTVAEGTTVEILNIQGQRMLTSTEKQINISSLPNGTYMVRVQDAQNNVVVKRIVKN